MQTCSKCHENSPDSASLCVNCQADLSQWSETSVARRRFQENPRVRAIRIMVMEDCCPACREAYGTYAKDEVPSLPVEGCSHPTGCRCFYQPYLSDIYP